MLTSAAAVPRSRASTLATTRSRRFAGGPELSCTATPDTKIFVVGYSWECSSFTGDHTSNAGDNFVYGTNAGQLRQCARNNDLQEAPTVTVDGKSVTVTEVETSPLNIVLPADNIFPEPAGKEGKSVAHGWITLLNPLTVGEHQIVDGAPNEGRRARAMADSAGS
jgi:hypothetical protein